LDFSAIHSRFSLEFGLTSEVPRVLYSFPPSASPALEVNVSAADLRISRNIRFESFEFREPPQTTKNLYSA
jgi:hypothetical protein